MSWFKRNWKAFLIGAATAVTAIAADHTIGYKVASQVLQALSSPAPTSSPADLAKPLP